MKPGLLFIKYSFTMKARSVKIHPGSIQIIAVYVI